MIPTKILFNPDAFVCDPFYEEVDESVINELFHYRFNKCHFCEEYNQREVMVNDEPVIVSYCGNRPIEHKWKVIYSEDDNGNVFDHTTHDNKFGYVCKLKKW